MNGGTHRRHDKLRMGRVRPIFEVKSAGAQQKKEIPFVGTVLGNFVGHAKGTEEPFRERKLEEIAAHNFDDKLKEIGPHLSLRVPDKISKNPDAPPVSVILDFGNMGDYEPDQLVKRIPNVAELLEERQKLVRLRETLIDSPKGDDLLQGVIAKTLLGK